MLSVVTSALESIEREEAIESDNASDDGQEDPMVGILPSAEHLALVKELNAAEHRALQQRVEAYTCPITLEVIQDPVVSKFGQTFEKWAITEWIQTHGSCPMTNLPLATTDLFPCLSLKDIIKSDIDTYGIEVVSDARCVKNAGLISISDAAKASGVELVSGLKMRERDNVSLYHPNSAYLIFPKPTQFLGFGATASITLKHIGLAGDFDLVSWDRDAVMRAHASRSEPSPSGSFKLKPGVKQGFDIQGLFCIEIRQGDCALLSVTDYSASGGGCGNRLGMANRY